MMTFKTVELALIIIGGRSIKPTIEIFYFNMVSECASRIFNLSLPTVRNPCTDQTFGFFFFLSVIILSHTIILSLVSFGSFPREIFEYHFIPNERYFEY